MKQNNLQMLFGLLLIGMTMQNVMAQSKKPTIMILPSDNWCMQRYFTTNYSNQGHTVNVPNYQQAFQEDTELGQVIGNIGGILIDMGYSLKDAEQEIKSLNVKTAEDNVIISKTSGSILVESSLDVLKRRIKSDVIIQIWWKLNHEGGERSASFTLEAFDSYTNKRIASSTGTTMPSNDPVPFLLKTAVEENIQSFDQQMVNWFLDQEKNGREITLTIRSWDNWGKDLETDYGGEELTDHIQSWLQKNCVNGAFNLSDGTELFAQFEQVRIPLSDAKGNAMDARAFATGLRKHLQQQPFNITSKVSIRGLGEALIILGEK